MIPTPSLKHLTKEDYRNVYEPAEDTFILLDALEEDQHVLKSSPKPRIVCEIGPGSGCVSAFISSILGSSEAIYLSTDINPIATECTLRTGKANNTTLEPIVASLLSPLITRSKGRIDLLLFNPPYVPTTEQEEKDAQADADIQGSWAGGSLGINLIEKLFTDLDGLQIGTGIESMLSPGGSFYFVAIKQNDPHSLVQRLEQRGLQSQIVLSRRAGREHLFVIRATKADSNYNVGTMWTASCH
ncbi:unnamed protein product [Sympodiomycopsis kandeliae]